MPKTISHLSSCRWKCYIPMWTVQAIYKDVRIKTPHRLQLILPYANFLHKSWNFKLSSLRTALRWKPIKKKFSVRFVSSPVETPTVKRLHWFLLSIALYQEELSSANTKKHFLHSPLGSPCCSWHIQATSLLLWAHWLKGQWKSPAHSTCRTFWAGFSPHSPQGCADSHQHLAYCSDIRYHHASHPLS